jgi:mono/diheme cytochrome c family protein
MNGRLLALSLSLTIVLGACAKPHAQAAPDRNPASANDGARIYITNCSSCHQLDGSGIPGAFPGLRESSFVSGPAEPVIAIVKFGSKTMPAWNESLSDEDIAAVVSYIRTSWRNLGAPVSAADVATVAK